MIPKQFFEDWPLFKPMEFWEDVQECIKNVVPAFNAHCPKCGEARTMGKHEVVMDSRAAIISASPGQRSTVGVVVLVKSYCSGCDRFASNVLVHFRDDKKTIQKVGQFPPPTIQIPAELKKSLGTYSERYKHGLICEQQGFGIGAFGYYRRIVEGVIDDLLDGIAHLIPDAEKARYADALLQAKSSRAAQEKINLVKELLPDSLRPDGLNPLGVLHHALSEGLHALEEEECLEYAGQVRNVLQFLISQVVAAGHAKREFTEGMRKLLEKKSQSNN